MEVEGICVAINKRIKIILNDSDKGKEVKRMIGEGMGLNQSEYDFYFNSTIISDDERLDLTSLKTEDQRKVIALKKGSKLAENGFGEMDNEGNGTVEPIISEEILFFVQQGNRLIPMSEERVERIEKYIRNPYLMEVEKNENELFLKKLDNIGSEQLDQIINDDSQDCFDNIDYDVNKSNEDFQMKEVLVQPYNIFEFCEPLTDEEQYQFYLLKQLGFEDENEIKKAIKNSNGSFSKALDNLNK